jgi:hypothetical protein
MYAGSPAGPKTHTAVLYLRPRVCFQAYQINRWLSCGCVPRLSMLLAEASARQQPQHMQQQLSQLAQQLQAMQQRAAAKEASSRKYKDAVRAFKVKLQERDEALGQRQAQILELHTELSQLQRLLKMGPLGVAAAAGAGLRGSSSRGGGQLQEGSCWPCGSPGRCGSSRPHFSRGSAEDAVAAATDGEQWHVHGWGDWVHGWVVGCMLCKTVAVMPHESACFPTVMVARSRCVSVCLSSLRGVPLYV